MKHKPWLKIKIEQKNMWEFSRGKRMARKKTCTLSSIARSLDARLAAMREAQRVFATYTQEQVDKIYMKQQCSEQSSYPAAQMAVEETAWVS